MLGLNEKETELYKDLMLDILDSCIKMADRFNIDRDNFIEVFAKDLTAMSMCCTFADFELPTEE